MGKKKGKGKGKKGPWNAHKFGPRVNRPEVVFTQSLLEFLCEYQSKYPNLFNISKENNHKLLDEMTCEIYQRLTHLINDMKDEMTNHNLTRNYRIIYPHSDDLKFIQTKEWAVNKKLGQPLRDVSVEMLKKYNAAEEVLTVGELLGSSSWILTPIAAKIISHIQNLDTSESGAKKTVRDALKKEVLGLQELLIDSINETVMPNMKDKWYGKMRIYGEPRLPATNMFQPIIAKFSPSGQFRSHRMFNCAMLNVPTNQIEPFLKIDGTVVANARLVVCRSILPEYRLPALIVEKIKEFFGISGPSASIGLDTVEVEDGEAAEDGSEESGESDE